MSLPIFQTASKDILLLQTSWVPQLNAVLANPVTNGLLLKDISLASGTNVINHKLGRALQGYVITGMHGVFVQIYDTPSPMPSLTLILNASASGSIDLLVF